MNSTVIFVADCHLRDSQWARRDRAVDFQNALSDVVTTALREGAKAICCSGDILDQVRPSPSVIRFLFRLNERLEQAGLPMYVITGDHDKTDPHWTTLLKDNNDPTSSASGIILLDNQLVTIPGTDLTVYGLSFIGKTREPFMPLWATLPKADILLAHTTVVEFCKFPAANALTLADLPMDQYRVISVGDIHVHEQRELGDGTVVLSPGSTELCKGNEPLDKAVWAVDMATPPVVRSLPVRTRKVLRYVIPSEEALREALADLATHAAANPVVLFDYDPSIEGVVARFGTIVDSDKAILRGKPIFRNAAGGAEDLEEDENKPLVAFLPQFITPGAPLYGLAASLLPADAPANELIDAFIDERLAKIAS